MSVFFKLCTTFRGFAMVGQSKHKSSILHRSSIEEIPLNFVLLPHYCKTLVVGSAILVSCFQVAISAPSLYKYKLIIKFYNGVFGLSRKVWFQVFISQRMFPKTYFQHKVYRQSSVRFSTFTQDFSITISINFFRKK